MSEKSLKAREKLRKHALARRPATHRYHLITMGLAVCLLLAGALSYELARHRSNAISSNAPRAAKHVAVQPSPKPSVVSNPIVGAPHTPKPDYTIPPITDGMAPFLTHIPTKQPVVFLGIDDGANKQPFELQMMKDNDVHATLFLANLFIKDDPTFFKDFITAGSLIEDHTLTHPNLTHLTYEQQKHEICGQADLEAEEFGRRPVLFRPPGGSFNDDTKRAAAACGMKAVVNWIAKANGGSMQYQIGHSLRPGDIVLMHFRPEFRSDMQAFLDAEHAAGLHTELLEDWLPS